MHSPILQYPHPVLRMKCSPVVDFGEVRAIVGRMVAAVNTPFLPRKAIGLAANQVGITKRVIIVLQGGQWVTMVNPRSAA
jgi:peptide deformylase